MNSIETIARVSVVWAGWLFIGALIGAIMLRAAIWLYNRLAGGVASSRSVPQPSFSYAIVPHRPQMIDQPERSVPQPPFGYAMVICFVAGLATTVIVLLLNHIVEAGAQAVDADPSRAELLIQIITIPVSLGVVVVMLKMMLPTSFGRALLLMLCHLANLAIIGGIVYGFVYFVLGG